MRPLCAHALVPPRLVVAGRYTVAVLPLRAALPVPDPNDGSLILPPGFRALVVADNRVVGKRVGNTPERLRHLAIAPNGDIYAKGKFGGLRDA